MSDALPPAEPRSAAAHPLARLVGAKLGNFRLERLIGRGRMGAVYLAKDEALLRPTAVKVLAWADGASGGHDPVQWFLAEARLVARINDPRVVQIYGAARHGDWFYIAMEYVPGRSCEALLAEAGRLSPAAATDLLWQAASALQAAHRSGVVHRDVKPANLLVAPSGAAKLGDFGMALGAAGGPGGRERLRAGTPFYTAPEIWRSGAATPASDLYALGATYFHLLTGHPPYEAVDVATVERAHLQAPIPDPAALAPGLPPGCGALARRLLAKAPGDRHPTAEAVMREAADLLQVLAPGRAPPSASRSTPAAPAAASSGAGARPPPLPAPRAASDLPAGPQAGEGRAPVRPTAGRAAAPSASLAASGPPSARPGLPRLAALTALACLPGVRRAALGDLAGALVDAAGDGDGDALAAEASVLAASLREAGEPLGLGALQRLVASGPTGATVVAVRGRQVAAARVEPPRGLPAVEHGIETVFQEEG